MGIKKELELEPTNAENKLHELEKQLDGTLDNANRLLEVKEQYNQILERVRCHDYRTYIARAHDSEGKAGRLLAWLSNPEMRGSPIAQLQTTDGNVVHSQGGINTTYQDYFTESYGRRVGPSK